jgi:threonine/homoserine/homoserine lactone efflux protein
MGAAIGDVLGLAAGVAVSPLPIVAMILLLATPRGRANGSLFAVGWLAGLAGLGTLVLALAGPADASSGGEPAAWTGWLKLVLGVLALLLAVRQWRGRPAAGAEPEMPKWMASLDRMRPGGALGLGALLSAVNPKNGGLTIAAAASIAAAGLAGRSRRSSWPSSCWSGPSGCSPPWLSTWPPGTGRRGPSIPGRSGPPTTTRP